MIDPSHYLQAGQRLRLASFNIQTGIRTSRYHHYVTRSWQHLLPTESRQHNLNRIANILREFDIVGLQEVDGGGRRSNYIVQTEYLANHGGFPYWHNQVNRRIGRLALHSNGLLSRVRPASVEDHALPGLPGRGVLLAHFGEGSSKLTVCILHLALGQRTRLRQLDFVSRMIRQLPFVVLMGDLNCEPNSPEMDLIIEQTELIDSPVGLKTFPSWRPKRKLDHILVTAGLETENIRVIDFAFSDHLPVAIDVTLPDVQ